MKLISFATGNLYHFMNQLNVVEFIDGLGVDGIEYTYGRLYEERALKKSDIDILLKKIDVSMHVHFKFMKFPDRIKQDTADFYKIINDYKEVNAKRLVVHPDQTLPSELIKIGQSAGIQFITENLRKRHGNDKKKSHEQNGFESVLNANKRYGLCLDVSHAYSWSDKETKRIIDTWKDKIMQIHFSVTHYTVNHLSTQQASSKFLRSMSCLKELDVPIVIEEDMRTVDKKFITSEINKIKQITGVE